MTHLIAIDVVADGRTTGAPYAVLELHAPTGTALAPHVLTQEDLTVLVLDGELEVVTGDGRTTVGPGAPLLLPRDVPRRLHARTDVHALGVVVPARTALLGLVRPPLPAGDDLAALLAAAGVGVLPATWRSAAR